MERGICPIVSLCVAINVL